MRRARPLAALVLLAGCAPPSVLMTPPRTVEPPPGQEQSTTGEVGFSAGGVGAAVAYGPWRVKGPGIELRYAGKNEWAGTLAGAEARVVARAGRITGPGLDLVLVPDGEAMAIQGTWSGRTVALVVGPRGLRGTVERGSCSFDLRPAGPGTFSGRIGCTGAADAPSSGTGTLRLAGEAIRVPSVLLPQFVLALLTALPT